MQDQFSLLAMFMKGWYATYPLLAISVICVTIIFERIWALWGVGGRATRLADRMIALLREGKFSEALAMVPKRRGPSERVLHEVIAEAESAPRNRLEEIDEERRFAELLQLRGLIWVLATSGASAPFIGLFGTVVGILVAFQSMAVMGTGGFSVVAAGISEALISTALGLIVAIIAVIFYNYFSQRVERINATIHICAARLIDAAETGRRNNGH
ncbi:MAG TPA: MotA/TolQ/ExbB proton channel family protein [Candidatus Binataceae bacterium]|nr:MotA/TolQ/ExbB proton channel family protein [Candidatus Binataceae bacterium]